MINTSLLRDDRLDLSGLVCPPRTVFHYTSSAGLRGILESGMIWATDLEFLNDERELKYGLDLLMPLLRERVLKRLDSSLSRALLAQLGGTPGSRHFVACFCEQGDLLSQWRGYASPGGYSLGIDTHGIAVGGDAARGSAFRRIWYNAVDARSFVEAWADTAADGFVELFSPFVEALSVKPARDVSDEELAESIYRFDARHYWRLERLCAVLKDPAFVEEEEWRILRSTHMGLKDRPAVKFRDGALGLTPYIDVDLRDATGRVPVFEIVVGPGPHARLRVTAAQLLLEQLGYSRDVVVRPSSVPYRP